MNAIVIEHVKVEDLPQAWRAKLAKPGDAHVTVRIEEEPLATGAQAVEDASDDPAFGIWRDRSDMANMTEYMRTLRAPRYARSGSRGQS